MSGTKPKRLIVGISGASGIIYGIRALEMLKKIGVDWARVEGVTPLLWYRKESFEVIMKEGRVAGVEFPARQERIAKAAGGYYEPGVDWSRCAPIAR